MDRTIKNAMSGLLFGLLIMAAMAVTALLLASCADTEMDITKVGAEPKIVLYCFPTPESDTTCITVMRSVPVTEREPETMYGATTAQLRLPDAKVSFLLNGVEQSVKYAPTDTGSVQAGSYYVACHIAEGDKIEVNASANGLPQASAQTTVPKVKAIKDVRKTTVIHDLTQYDQLLVDLDGAAMRGSYYAVTVSKAYTLTGKDYQDSLQTINYCYRCSVDLTDEPLVAPASSDVDLFSFSNSFYDSFYIFNGDNITSDAYTLRLNVDGTHSIWTDGFKSGTIVNPRLEVRLYKIDAALYRFLKSINDINDNDLAKYGLAPILPTYSNVSGGLGAIGGCGVEKVELKLQLDQYDFDDTLYTDY